MTRQTGGGRTSLNGAVTTQEIIHSGNNIWDPLMFLAENENKIIQHLTQNITDKRGIKW